MFHVNKMRTHSSFLQCESCCFGEELFSWPCFFQQIQRNHLKSFKIFAISVGFCLHSPDKRWVNLGGVEVALVLPGNRVFMSFHVFALSVLAIKNWD